MNPNLRPNVFWLKVRTRVSQPSISVRTFSQFTTWFTSRPQAELDRVKVVVLDMSKSFYASIHQVFGDQVEVIDRFHVVQQAVGALDGVLRSIKTQLEP